jgi:peptidylprolyl isomerase
MGKAKQGDKVQVHYTGLLPDGTIFDSTLSREPIEFTLGEGKVMPGFEKAVLGMTIGESKTATVPPEEGYGDREDAKVLLVNKDKFTGDVDSKEGERIAVRLSDGEARRFTVAKVTADVVVLDGNHPLAGKDLTFKIKLLAVG